MGATGYAHEQELVNTLGHAAGVLVFGIFLALLLRQRTPESLRRNRLTLTAAGLALVWNLCSLAVFGAGESDSLLKRIFATLGFSVLSLLPAVLLHLCFAGRLRMLIAAGYFLSAAATANHLAELVFPDTALHRNGLTIITIGFSVLTVVAAAASFRQMRDDRRAIMSRALASMGLILFSASFAHFAKGHADDAWSAELAFHHAGIPLAMFVILQNQRFVLLDAFMRFLGSIMLAGAFMFVLVHGALALAADQGPGSSFRVALGLVAGCLLLVAYALARGALEKWLGRLLFGGPNPELASQRLREMAANCADENEFLARASKAIGDSMGCEVMNCPGLDPGGLVLPAAASELPGEFENAGVELVIPLRLGPGDIRQIMLGPRAGGKRFLSEDLGVLSTLAAQVSGHVEQLRQSELRRLVTQAELRALQAQIHPHFLFNALNTLYGVIPRESPAARRLVLNLSDVLRYFFRSSRPFISLEEEITVIKAYLEIEKLRLGPKLVTELDIDPDALRQQIPVLSLEPLVENAIKHGVATQAEGGTVRVVARLVGGDLELLVENTGAEFSELTRASREEQGSVGLANVSRRLALCYGAETGLNIESTNGLTRIGFRVPATQLAEALSR